VDHPYSWLKYLPARHLDDESVDFDGMKVESPSGENLGKVEGFVVDADSGRPYYAVVDAGGWFKSKHFLLPVGHVHFESKRKTFKADVPKAHVERFPGFDLSKFDEMTPDDLKRFNVDTLQACTVAGVVYMYSDTEPYTAAWERADFRYPEWWRGQQPADRATAPASTSGKAVVGSGMASAESYDRSRERDAVVAKGTDPSPHLDGRAQPGDVIGVETGGEQTHVGETADDENKRRESAQKDAEKLRGRER
jgi:hypothetical protein